MDILAQTSQFSWTEFLRSDLPLWSFFVVFLFMSVRYVPKLVNKHIVVMDHATDTLSANTHALNAISAQVQIDGAYNARQHQAAGHLSRALEEMSPETRKDQVRFHLDNMQRVLRNEDGVA